jgi:16S rRNA (cytosine1402-N4)-methyltransferase
VDNYHTPVLSDEVDSFLRVRSGGKYIDGTIGGGGHAARILKSSGKVLGIDWDLTSILHLKKKFESEISEGKLMLVHGNLKDMGKYAKKTGFENVDGILLDLGVSSYQLDKSGRGFSFRRNEPLDMRMTNGLGEDTELTAHEIINKWSEEELYEIFSKYGEEIRAREVASEIVSSRPIETTEELAQIISKVIRTGEARHPATKIFQALRIAVNSEIENLQKGLDEGFKLLNKGARFEVISFHSLEDRTVKLYFLKLERGGLARILTKKPVIATEEEIRQNRRSRSAKLRVIEKI